MKETYEVEVKFPLSDKEGMKQALIQAGGIPLSSEIQNDIYYDHPCRSFSETDESVRLRHRTRIAAPSLTGSRESPIELTYKGPKIDKSTKTRIEYTVNLDENELDSMTQILLNTGFERVGTVIKHREFFDINGISATLDVVTDVGEYVEFELMAHGKNEMQKARDRILKLAKALGLNEQDMVRDSYLELYFQAKL